MFCPKCNAEIKKTEAKFCPNCGNSVLPAPPSGNNDDSSTYSKNQTNNSVLSLVKHSKLRLFLIVISILIGVTLVYFVLEGKIKNELNDVKNHVISGDFETANFQLEKLEESFGFFLPLFEINLDELNDAIEEQYLCVQNEYPTYNRHSGIAGCVFWTRNDYLEKHEVWINEYKAQEADATYCNETNDADTALEHLRKTLRNDNSDPKCSYDAFKELKREENWDYFTSSEWDEFTEQCALESCPLPKELNF